MTEWVDAWKEATEAMKRFACVIEGVRRDAEAELRARGIERDHRIPTLDQLAAVGNSPDHEHQFVDPANEAVESNGYLVCTVCGLLQPPAQDRSPEPSE